MDKRFWGVIAAIVVIFIGIIWINNRKAGAPNGDNGSASAATNHVEGENAKGVTLVEYGDFQCPACYSYYPTVKEVVDKYKADIHFQFRNFPLTQIHPNAFAGARAAEAASKQGKYWEMHDQLYQNQDPNGKQGWVASSDPLNQYFTTLAKSAGVANIDQFKTDYASSQVNSSINADIKAGQKLNVSSTPSFFLNGKKLEGSDINDASGRPSAEAFGKSIDAAIAEKSKQ